MTKRKPSKSEEKIMNAAKVAAPRQKQGTRSGITTVGKPSQETNKRPTKAKEKKMSAAPVIAGCSW
jgi:hypothetical protein